jgi:ribosome-associated protein
MSSDRDVVHQWCAVAAQAASDKKAANVVILDVGNLLAITDAFVITSASNDRLVRTIVEEIEHKLKDVGGPSPLRTEGLREAQWVLMDYGDFVVHVFLDEVRAYYDLERLWADAPTLAWDDRSVSAAAGE